MLLKNVSNVHIINTLRLINVFSLRQKMERVRLYDETWHHIMSWKLIPSGPFCIGHHTIVMSTFHPTKIYYISILKHTLKNYRVNWKISKTCLIVITVSFRERGREIDREREIWMYVWVDRWIDGSFTWIHKLYI